MIGVDDDVAMRLKDACLVKKDSNSSDHSTEYAYLENMYNQVLDLIYKMYNSANLIHGDLSEYNILVREDILYVIDVGQSVDTTHLYSDIFLMNDILNINRFFERRGLGVEDHKSIYERTTGKEMTFELNGNEMNKLGFMVDEEILLKNDSNDESDVSSSSETDDENSTSDEEETTHKGGNFKAFQFTKNKFLTKDVKLERRRVFKVERKMKRMAREKTTVVKKITKKRR